MGRKGIPVTSAVRVPEAPEAGPESRPARRSWLPAVICAGYLLAAVVLTWRLWAHPSSATVAGNPPDHSQFAWFLRYSAIAVAHGRLPALVTTAMNAPHGISMMWNTTVLLPGIVLTPVTLLAGPQVSLTVLLTLGFAGSAASLFYVLRRYGASMAAAAAGGAVYGFSPALTHTAMGHYQLQLAVLPPLIVDAVLRLGVRPARPLRAGAWLGLLVAAQIFIGEEMLFESGLAAIVVVAALAASRPKAVRPVVRQAGAGLAAAGGVILLLAGWALWSQFTGPLVQHGTAFYTDFYKNDLAGFVTPDASQLIHTGSSAAAAAKYAGLAPEYLAYLGIPLLVVLIIVTVACWRSLPVRICAVTAAVLLLLSLGGHPLLSTSANPLTQSTTGLTLPWGWLEHVPVISAGLPNRLSIVADGAAAGVLAFGIDLAYARLRRTSLSQARATAIVAVIAIAVVLPLVPRPLSSVPAAPLPDGWSTTLDALRLPASARVLVVPVPTSTIDQALRWQADSGQQVSLIGGYFEGPAPDGRAYIDGPGFPELVWYLDYLWEGKAWVAARPPAPSQADIAATLRYWGPQAVVADAASRPALERYLIGILGQPTIRYGSMLGWRL
jgi:hypothetical protein